MKFTDLDSRNLKETLIQQQSALQFDCYCIDCDKDSTFKTDENITSVPRGPSTYFKDAQITEQLNKNFFESYKIYFQCQREKTHKYHFLFKIMDSTIIKIGQYPSEASIQASNIKRYRTVLKKDYQDFSKAIGLYSHGIGIGSFVYVRRIFENLVEEKRIEAAKNSSWDDEKYNGSKMNEKIKLLQDFLPSVLVENRQIYSIISKGIHELSEEECLELFPDVQIAIELILDEKIYLQQQERKVKDLRSFISKTSDRLKK